MYLACKGLKNIMREDLLPELVPYMVQSSEDGDFKEGETIIIPIDENPDLRTVKDKFKLHKDSGMSSARITLQYPSRVSSQRAVSVRTPSTNLQNPVSGITITS